MQRVTITLEPELLEIIDTLAAKQGYASRSEAVRDIVRGATVESSLHLENGQCVAALTYVYDHETRELARRLMNTQHEHHDLSVASLHIHLDHDTCLEVAILRGPAAQIEEVAASVTSQRGVRYGKLHIIPVSDRPEPHSHSHDRHISKKSL